MRVCVRACACVCVCECVLVSAGRSHLFFQAPVGWLNSTGRHPRSKGDAWPAWKAQRPNRLRAIPVQYSNPYVSAFKASCLGDSPVVFFCFHTMHLLCSPRSAEAAKVSPAVRWCSAMSACVQLAQLPGLCMRTLRHCLSMDQRGVRLTSRCPCRIQPEMQTVSAECSIQRPFESTKSREALKFETHIMCFETDDKSTPVHSGSALKINSRYVDLRVSASRASKINGVFG